MSNETRRVVYRVKRTPTDQEMPSFIERSDKYGPFVMPEITIYDVYQDGTFHYFDPETGKPTKEPEEMIQARMDALKELEKETSMIGTGGIAKFNCASHEEYQKAFMTLCRLGYGPGTVIFPAAEKYLIDVDYFGEDEPWINVYEFYRRRGIDDIIVE